MKRIILSLFAIWAVGLCQASTKDIKELRDSVCRKVSEIVDTTVVPDWNKDVFILVTTIPETDFDEDSQNSQCVQQIFEQVPHLRRDYMYTFLSADRKDGMCLMHWADTLNDYENYDVLLILPKKVLNKIKAIDFDLKFPRLTREEIEKIEVYLKKQERQDKRVWLIDRRFMTDKTITLIEVSVPEWGDVIYPTNKIINKGE